MHGLNYSEKVQAGKLSFTSRPSLDLKIGEVVTGTVVQNLSSKQVLLLLKNQMIEAKTEIPLEQGEVIQFEVASVEKEIRLRRLTKAFASTKMDESILKTLRGLRDTKRTLAEMNSIFTELKQLPPSVQKILPELKLLNSFFNEHTDISEEVLKTIFESSGIFFEAKLKQLSRQALKDEKISERIILKDLKGVLLKIKSRLQSKEILEQLQKEQVKQETIIDLINTLVNQIKYQQLQSKLNQSLQSYLPFFWMGLKDGTIIFREPKENRTLAPEKRFYTCIVNLDLEEAGKLIVRIHFQGGAFYVQLITENQHFATLLLSKTEKLRDRFGTIGLNWGDLSISHQGKIDFDHPETEGVDLKI